MQFGCSQRDLALANEPRPNVGVPEVRTGHGRTNIDCGSVHGDRSVGGHYDLIVL